MRLPVELEILLLRGVPKHCLETACKQSSELGCLPAEYLVQKNIVSLETLYSAFAECCGVPFLPERSFRPRTLNNRVIQLGSDGHGPLLVSLYENKAYYAIAPDISQFGQVREHLQKHPEFARQIRIASPSALRHASTVQNTPSGDLETRFPEMSAQTRLSATQLTIVAIGFVSLLLGFMTTPAFWFMLGAALFGLACLLSGLVRAAAALNTLKDPLSFAFPERLYASDIIWPEYTVLVPLHREAAVVKDLLKHLGRIDYPKHRLQILFLVEQDDVTTRQAFPKSLPPEMELVVVPPGTPRTKPRALSYGLLLATGSLVTVFDAEDRPDADQLRKAALAFALAPKDLGCLQAHLTIDNHKEGFFARQFAMEYASLFDQLLPWCYKKNWPFPLGGTSNHFRREALEAVGGWDRFNVTEDADLGIRLARFGYRSGVLASATGEEAPTTLRAWFAQRSRWYKGWLQTFCVHMRNPGFMLDQIGTQRAFAMGAVFLGSLTMIALHPVFFSAFLIFLFRVAAGFAAFETLSWLSLVLIAAGAVGYAGAVFAAAVASFKRYGLIDFMSLFAIPVYWLFAGLAFYRAVWEFIRQPHHWHKTAHGVSRQRQQNS
ncbi:cellulose synthase/poly-beta-1,6-N-acetylglucosamine synthase-like glycosyltransferase [Roseibium hamelinense]|uniref:Cellulose synthase/poly-beta-1,6-N-acetylglucosamine synthase-like glycosyltransferase n=1 Tax=Roseibium hamelinense TaxID=150831 RepID=A0A562STN5_9HYPH|nr:glycosyltransferase family 2 protein [Roseibium hamelinense]MTI42735.1 glycosyl transferase family 2 [Roseibium hamelinense]TWI84615.1 cellulose synthase/poly-beta-1,6-N-acetylglucosamine synthase-like glycosyltransferase [Roseibium hamelinense]